MSSKLILCEGKWDLNLIEEYISQNKGGIQTDIVKMEEVTEDQRGEETRAISQLKNPYYPYNALIKSENGREFYKQTYSASLMTLAEGEFEINLLIDCDHRGVEGWLSDVNEKCVGRYTKPVQSITIDTKYSTDALTSHVGEIEINGMSVKRFGIVGFESTMEETVGIDKRNHSSDEKQELIEDYASNPDFNRAIERSFF